MANGGEALDAPQILRLVAESAMGARDRAVAEIDTLDARRALLVMYRDKMEILHQIAAPVVPNPGTMEGEG